VYRIMNFLLAAAQVLLVLLPAAHAGGYGRGKPHRLALYKPAEYYWNHVPAQHMSSGEDLQAAC
jgi:hypothetical protein